MRGFNLHIQDNPVYDKIFGINMSEAERRLNAYRMQAKMYLITNADSIKSKYANLVLSEIFSRSPSPVEYFVPNSLKLQGNNYLIKLIKECIFFCEDLLVLINPKTEGPCVVVNAYAFTEYDIEAYEERLLTEYINNSDSYHDIIEKGMPFVVKQGAKYGIKKGSNILGRSIYSKGVRYFAISGHNASGHSSLMRIQRSFRGKKAQREALLKMYNRSSQYKNYASKSLFAGKTLVRLSKYTTGAFRLLDVFKPYPTNQNQSIGYVEEKCEEYLIKELPVYCDKYNNYNLIINQLYYEQG